MFLPLELSQCLLVEGRKGMVAMVVKQLML
jgi:hypothetical protein